MRLNEQILGTVVGYLVYYMKWSEHPKEAVLAFCELAWPDRVGRFRLRDEAEQKAPAGFTTADVLDSKTSEVAANLYWTKREWKRAWLAKEEEERDDLAYLAYLQQMDAIRAMDDATT